MGPIRTGTLILLALLVNTPGAAAPQSRRPLLAVELSHVQLTPGMKITLLARYRDRPGESTVELDDTDALFRVVSAEAQAKLRDLDIRHRLLSWRVQMTEVKRGRSTFRVLSIAEAPPATEFFERISFEELTHARRLDIVKWALQETKSESELHRAARDQLLETLAARADARPDSVPNLDWLPVGEEHLREDRRWVQLVLTFAERFGDRPRVQKALRESGFRRDFRGWQREADLLRQWGLVRHLGRVMTEARRSLEIAATDWERTGDSVALLRELTSKQYMVHARSHEVAKGMHRDELVIAWGYPSEVTWYHGKPETRGEKKPHYEIWIYPDAEAYLRDGTVFSWKSKG